jgi:hypothetical protein
MELPTLATTRSRSSLETPSRFFQDSNLDGVGHVHLIAGSRGFDAAHVGGSVMTS